MTSQINWPQIVANLERAGVSRAAIGRACGRSADAIGGIASRRTIEPAFPVGNAMLELWLARVARLPAGSQTAATREALRGLPMVTPTGVQSSLGMMLNMGRCDQSVLESFAARVTLQPQTSA